MSIDKQYCTRCGSDSVEGRCYVNMNTFEVEDDPQFDDGPFWCNGCQDNCQVSDDPEEYKAWGEINKGEEKYESKNNK